MPLQVCCIRCHAHSGIKLHDFTRAYACCFCGQDQHSDVCRSACTKIVQICMHKKKLRSWFTKWVLATEARVRSFAYTQKVKACFCDADVSCIHEHCLTLMQTHLACINFGSLRTFLNYIHASNICDAKAHTDPQYLCMCTNAADVYAYTSTAVWALWWMQVDVYACTSTAVWALARVIDASWCIGMHKVQLFKR